MQGGECPAQGPAVIRWQPGHDPTGLRYSPSHIDGYVTVTLWELERLLLGHLPSASTHAQDVQCPQALGTGAGDPHHGQAQLAE